jgi:hypothetical protein
LNPCCPLNALLTHGKKFTSLSNRRAIMNNHVVQRAHTKVFLSGEEKKLGLENVKRKLI